MLMTVEMFSLNVKVKHVLAALLATFASKTRLVVLKLVLLMKAFRRSNLFYGLEARSEYGQ